MAGVSGPGDRWRVTVATDPPLVVELDRDGMAAPQRGVHVRPVASDATDRAEGRRRVEVVVDGWRFEVAVEPAALAALRDRARRAAAESRPHARESLRAQIPGRIVAVHVSAGEAVAAGDRLLSIEAMKMENEVRAAHAGTIASVSVTSGDRVELGDELVVIE